MTNTLLALAATTAYLVSVVGWGRAVMRASRTPDVAWGVAAVVGLASWACIGGILNLIRLATPPLLDGIALLGLAFAALDARGRLTRQRGPDRRWTTTVAWLVPTIVLAIFIAFTQVPPAAYNFHDDFTAYFVHPVRMLETGSVFGSPVSSIGRGTLGAQAFLQGFVLSHLPIEYVNAVDALFCVVMCLAALGSYASSRRLGGLPTLLAIALFVAINPQYVNVSSLYSGAGMIVGLLLLGADVDPFEATGWDRLRRTVPYALLYAALAALKHTFVFFVALHFLAWTATSFARRPPRDVVLTAASIVGASALALAPWLAIYLPHYRSAAMSESGGVLRAATERLPNPLDPTPLAYGASFLAYTLVVMLVALLGTIAFVRWHAARADGASSLRATLVAGCAATVASFVVFVTVLARMLGARNGIRYFCPIIIGAAPPLMLIGWDILRAAKPARAVVAGGVALCVAVFVPSLVQRAQQAVRSGSVLAFSSAATSAPSLEYNREVMQSADRIRVIQARVPPGEALFAWTATPFQLDFRRNRVLEADIGGLANPWGPLPRVEYVMWDHAGFAVRSLRSCQGLTTSGSSIDEAAGRGCVTWLRTMSAASGFAEILYDDGRTVLFRVPPGALDTARAMAGER